MADGSRRNRDDDDDDRPARRRRTNDYDDDDPGFNSPRPASQQKGVNVIGVIALVLGIVGLILSLIPCIGIVGLPVAGIGLLLGVIGIFTSGKTTGRGFPIAGTCVSVAGLLISTIWLVMWGGLFASSKQAVEQAQVRMEEQAKVAEEERKKAEKEMKEAKAITVTARTLAEDYDKNPISADTKYKSKILEVTGVVDKVDTDKFGRAWIVIDIEGEPMLKFEFAKEAQRELAKVEAKKPITIRGRCKGKSTTRDGDDQVVLENCAVIKK